MEDRKMIEKLKEHLEEALSKLYIENTRIDNEMTNLHYQHGIAGYDQDLPSRFIENIVKKFWSMPNNIIKNIAKKISI